MLPKKSIHAPLFVKYNTGPEPFNCSALRVAASGNHWKCEFSRGLFKTNILFYLVKNLTECRHKKTLMVFTQKPNDGNEYKRTLYMYEIWRVGMFVGADLLTLRKWISTAYIQARYSSLVHSH